MIDLIPIKSDLKKEITKKTWILVSDTKISLLNNLFWKWYIISEKISLDKDWSKANLFHIKGQYLWSKNLYDIDIYFDKQCEPWLSEALLNRIKKKLSGWSIKIKVAQSFSCSIAIWDANSDIYIYLILVKWSLQLNSDTWSSFSNLNYLYIADRQVKGNEKWKWNWRDLLDIAKEIAYDNECDLIITELHSFDWPKWQENLVWSHKRRWFKVLENWDAFKSISDKWKKFLFSK